MPIVTAAEFLEQVALERQLLDEGVPIANPTPPEITFVVTSLGVSRVINLDFSDSIGSQAIEDYRRRLLALFFGAAWKVLDLLIEHAIDADNSVPAKTNWQATKKAELLMAGKGLMPYLPADIWSACKGIYNATFEVRNALVHRMAVVAPNGDLICAKRDGVPLPVISAAEQVAFCEVMQIVMLAIERGSLPERERRRALARLTSLSNLHGVCNLPTATEGDIVRVKIDLPADRVLLVNAIKQSVMMTTPGVGGIDLILRDPTTGLVLRGELDSVEDENVLIDPHSPPIWLRCGMLPG